MCGIAGYSGVHDPDFLKSSLSALARRGPDASGFWTDENSRTGLCHTRLAIIDLSDAGKQPMFDSKGSSGIVFNGEIYNYRELRGELEAAGSVFSTSSDTEVLIQLYEKYGIHMLDRLNGIFAFAIWDKTKRQLFIARDGIGVKPLYYTNTGKAFYFASEIKALAKIKGFDKSISPEALHYYLAYLWCPSPFTMFRSVFKLEPGHAMIVENGAVIKKWEFYDIPCGNEYFKEKEPEIARMLADKVRDAVKRQMISDAPVGAFLSGGLDSSAITCFAREYAANGKLDCFTIGFENSGGTFDGFTEDLPYANRVARDLGVNLHTVTVGPDIISRLNEMIYFLDEPEADPSPMNVYLISELARKHGMKVLLSGTGGDDIFSGYRRHTALLCEKYWAWLPYQARLFLKNYTERTLDHSTAAGRRIARAFRFADRDHRERLAGYFLWMDDSLQNSLYSADFRKTISTHDVMAPILESLKKIPEDTNILNQMLYLEAKHFLADHNLNYTDKMGMAAGVEIRVPLLDIELVKFAAKIPPGLKHNKGTAKYIFKKAMEPYLSKTVIYRPKSGFGAPLRQWLHGNLKEAVEDLLSETNLSKRGIWNPEAVRNLIDEDRAGKTDAAYAIFSIMCIEWWMRIFTG